MRDLGCVAEITCSRSAGTLQHFADSGYSDLPSLFIFRSLADLL